MSRKFKTAYPELISIEKLKVEGYQRDLKARATRIANKFNPDLLGVITVSHRDGIYYVVDGQTRVTACRLKGEKTITAMIHEGLTKEEEAQLFVELNRNQKKVTNAEVFQAMVIARDPDTLMIKQVVEDNGYTISGATNKYSISCIKTLYNLLDKFGGPHLFRTLMVIRETWYGQERATNRYFIEGVAHFINTYRSDKNYDDAKFIKQLSKHTPIKLFAEMESDLTSNKVPVKAMNTLHKYYNLKLSKGLEHKHFSTN